MVKITALLLAGGKSKRMGKNKALLVYNGKTFLENVLKTVENFDEILIMSNESAVYQYLNLPVHEDVYRECGPMGGLHSGMLNSNNDWNLLLPCDMPDLTVEFINYIASQIESDYDAIIPLSRDGKKHPLVGIYNKALMEKIEESLISKKLKMVRFLDEIKVKYVDIDDDKFDVSKIFSNINTPEEADKLIK